MHRVVGAGVVTVLCPLSLHEWREEERCSVSNMCGREGVPWLLRMSIKRAGVATKSCKRKQDSLG